MIPIWRAVENWNEISPTIEQIKIISNYVKKDNRINSVLQLFLPFIISPDINCWAARTNICIDPYGNCYPCDNFDLTIIINNLTKNALNGVI